MDATILKAIEDNAPKRTDANMFQMFEAVFACETRSLDWKDFFDVINKAYDRFCDAKLELAEVETRSKGDFYCFADPVCEETGDLHFLSWCLQKSNRLFTECGSLLADSHDPCSWKNYGYVLHHMGKGLYSIGKESAPQGYKQQWKWVMEGAEQIKKQEDDSFDHDMNIGSQLSSSEI